MKAGRAFPVDKGGYADTFSITMADEQDEQVVTAEVEEPRPQLKITSGKKYVATLVNGETYFLGDKRFTKNVPVPVTAEEAMMLQDKHTQHSIMNPDETMTPFHKKRFVLKEAGSMEAHTASPTPTPRTRTRVSS